MSASSSTRYERKKTQAYRSHVQNVTNLISVSCTPSISFFKSIFFKACLSLQQRYDRTLTATQGGVKRGCWLDYFLLLSQQCQSRPICSLHECVFFFFCDQVNRVPRKVITMRGLCLRLFATWTKQDFWHADSSVMMRSLLSLKCFKYITLMMSGYHEETRHQP